MLQPLPPTPNGPQNPFAAVQTVATQPSLRLASYARWSSSGPGEESLADQDEQMSAWAAAHDHDIVSVHHDDHLSGTLSWEDRPGLFAAISAIKKHHADGLLLRGLDRFARDLMEQEFTLRMVWHHGGEVFEAQAARGLVPRDDPDDPTRKLVRTIMGGVWAFDRDLQVARMRGGKRRKSAAGGYIGGYPNRFGYRVVLGERQPHEGEQEIIRKIIRLRAQGEAQQLSLRKIAARLTDEHVPAPTQGGAWNHATVGNILKRET